MKSVKSIIYLLCEDAIKMAECNIRYIHNIVDYGVCHVMIIDPLDIQESI